MSSVYSQVHGAADPVAASNAKYRSELEDYGWFVRPADTENIQESSAGYYGGYPCESSAGAILAAKLAGDLDGILTLTDEDFEFSPSVDGLGRDISDPAYLDSLLPDGTPTYMARRDEGVQSSVNREADDSIDVPHTQGETLNDPSLTVAKTTPRKGKGRKICSPRTTRATRANRPSSTSRNAPRRQASPFDTARGSSTPELSSSCSSPPSSELSTPASSPGPVNLAVGPSTRTSPRKRKVTTKGDYMDADEFNPTQDQASSSVPQKRGRPGPIRFTCKWKELFGGACTSTSTTAQAHDRHIVTHLPEDSGHAFEGYLCSICTKGCNRRDSCQRHLNSCGKGSGYIITVDREWWWPIELFITDEFKKHVLPRPVGETRTTIERLQQIIMEHPSVRDKPYRSPKSLKAGEVDDQDGPELDDDRHDDDYKQVNEDHRAARRRRIA